MTDNVVTLVQPGGLIGPGIKVPVNAVLAGARKEGLDIAIVVGVKPDGEIYIAASGGHHETVFFLETAKAVLIRGD